MVFVITKDNLGEKNLIDAIDTPVAPMRIANVAFVLGLCLTCLSTGALGAESDAAEAVDGGADAEASVAAAVTVEEAATVTVALGATGIQAPAAPSFEMFTNLRCNGHYKVVWNTPVISLCKRYCSSDPECALFSQEPGGGRGCFLFKKFGCVHDFGWIAGRKRIVTDVGTWEDVPNLRCAGHYKIALWGTPSAQTCKELCAAEKKCTVFSLEQGTSFFSS